MKVGIIGVGHLAKSLLQGLAKAGWQPGDIILSPRGYAAELAGRHGFELAADNADLVARADVVVLSVRPNQATDAIADLGWRRGQTLLSACAGVKREALAAAALPAEVVRIMPITAAELSASPTVAFPCPAEVLPLLEAFGPVIEVSSEDEFEVASVSAAIYGWVQALIRDAVTWSAESGLDPAAARALVAQTFVASGRMIAEHDEPMNDILASLLTPGGITEAGLNHLESHGVDDAWRGAADIVLARLRAL